MNLKEWARGQGIHPVAAYRVVPGWQAAGAGTPLRGPDPGRRSKLIRRHWQRRCPRPGIVHGPVCRPRPSVTRVTAWTTAEGVSVSQVVTELGSALNGKRGKFLALLRDGSVAAIVAEHGIGSPARARNPWKPCFPRRDAGCRGWTPPGLTTTWSGT